MEFFTDLFNSMDGNIIEYCILGGIIVLVIILIASIVSCAKSLNGKDKRKKYSFVEYDEEKTVNDPIAELINEAKLAKEETSKVEEQMVEIEAIDDKGDVLVFDEDEADNEVVIASKIDIPEIIEEKEEVLEEKKQHNVQKLDIKSITREMELKLEEEANSVEMYEDEQEKTAIISYKELVEAASRIEANADKEEDFIDDVVFEFSSKKVNDDEISVSLDETSSKKFIPTLDISPVFGKKDSSSIVENDDLFEIEEVDLSEELHEGEDFLNNLKNFRSNLD